MSLTLYEKGKREETESGSFPLNFFPVSESQDGNLVFAAVQKTGNVFLMGKDDQQGNCNGKNPVGVVIYVENDEDKYREGDTG